MKLWELAKMHKDGYLDIDITDKEIDVRVAITVDTTEEPQDNYDRFIDLLAKNVTVEWWREDVVCLDLSGFYRPHREELAEAFDHCEDIWEFDREEFEYQMSLWSEGFIAGCSGDGTYKKLVEILSKEEH